jgi:hypothetical protein
MALSLVRGGLLKLLTIMLGSISAFMFSNDSFMCLSVAMFSSHTLNNCYTLLIDCSLYQYEVILSFLTNFGLKSALLSMNIATPAFFGAVFAWKIFFHPFTLSLCVCLCQSDAVLVGYKELGLVFLIQTHSLCILIGELRLLTFRVITERYVGILTFFFFAHL